MARTRNASHAFHADDGELLDKEGKPIPVTALHTPQAAMEALARPPAEPEPPPPPVPALYRCDTSTVQRDMDAWTLFRLLNLMMGPLSLELDTDGVGALPADVRAQFRRVQ